MADEKNGNDKKTIIRAAEFRGFAKAKIEDIGREVGELKSGQKGFKEALEKVEEAIVKINQYIVERKAVQNVRSTFFGILGGLLPVLVGFIFYKLFTK